MTTKWEKSIDEKNIREEMNYCYVAFIDILGFKNMISNEFDKVIVALNKVKEFSLIFCNSTNQTNIGNDFEDVMPKATMFSDSIVVSVLENECYLEEFIKIISRFQYELLTEGIAIRGGIELGYIYHDSFFVFGDALVNAYEIENKISKVPRIVIGKEAVEHSQILKDEEFSSALDYSMEYDDDFDELYPNIVEKFVTRIFDVAQKDTAGNYFADYLFEGIKNALENGNFKELENIIKTIQEGLSIEDENIKKKYIWLKDYYNKTLEKCEILTGILIDNMKLNNF